jgi:transcriptional regulator with XRE-family HTH domain
MKGELMEQKRISPHMRVLAERVHLLRRRVRLSQSALAKRAGMSPTTLSNIEQAKIPTITVEHLVALAEVLNTSPNCLLGVEPLQEGLENEQESEIEAAGVALVGA